MEQDWQSNIFRVEDRVAMLLKKQVLMDVSFEFDVDGTPKVLRAHKLMLASASPVFEAMFYGPLAEKSDQPISMEEIDMGTFSKMLKYIYLNVTDYKNLDEATKLYGAAKRFLLKALLKNCFNYIERTLDIGNAAKIFEFAKFYEENILMAAAMKLIKEETILAMDSPGFLQIDISTMIAILDEAQLRATEMDLFEALENLAKAQNVVNMEAAQIAIEKSELPECENHSNAFYTWTRFRAAIKKIDFSKMSAEQFKSGPFDSYLLLPQESMAIYNYLIQPAGHMQNYPEGFSQGIRKNRLRRVFFEVEQNTKHIGRIVIELREDVAPDAVGAFFRIFHRVQFSRNNFYYNGKKSYSQLRDRFILKHNKPGTVSALPSKRSHVITFPINCSQKKEFDNEYIVFGQVIEGMDVVRALANGMGHLHILSRGSVK